MIDKIASYNRLSDKGMCLVAKIAFVNEAIKKLLVNDSQEHIDEIIRMSKELDLALTDYQGTLVDSFAKIAGESESNESTVVEEENGYRL